MNEKNILFFLYFYILFSLQSQTTEKTLLIRDANTNLLIEDVVVFIAKTKQSFVSNKEGEVLLSLKSPSTIQITHFAYQSETVRSISLKEGKNTILQTQY